MAEPAWRPFPIAPLLERTPGAGIPSKAKVLGVDPKQLHRWLHDQLLTCGLHAWIASRPGPPAQPGTYVVRDHNEVDVDRWTWAAKR